MKERLTFHLMLELRGEWWEVNTLNDGVKDAYNSIQHWRILKKWKVGDTGLSITKKVTT